LIYNRIYFLHIYFLITFLIIIIRESLFVKLLIVSNSNAQNLLASLISCCHFSPLWKRPIDPDWKNKKLILIILFRLETALEVKTNLLSFLNFFKFSNLSLWILISTPSNLDVFDKNLAFFVFDSTRWPFSLLSKILRTNPGKPAPDPMSINLSKPLGKKLINCALSIICLSHKLNTDDLLIKLNLWLFLITSSWKTFSFCSFSLDKKEVSNLLLVVSVGPASILHMW